MISVYGLPPSNNILELPSKVVPLVPSTMMIVDTSLKILLGVTEIPGCACAYTGAGILASIKASKNDIDTNRGNPGFIVLPILFYDTWVDSSAAD